MTTFLRQSEKIISAAPAATALAPTLDIDAVGEFGDASDSDEVELRDFSVTVDQHGERLDRILTQWLPEFSRNHLQQIIADGLVRLDGQPVTKTAQRLRVGQACQIELRPTPQSQAFKPQAMDIDVLYEDEHLLVVNKPAGLVVHPAPGNWSGTLLNGLLARDPKAQFLPRAGIVHRLDKDTSGVMVVARSRAAMEALVAMIAARSVSRLYLALAHQSWRGLPEREVQGAIGRDPRRRLRMAVVDLARLPGKPAHTTVRFLANAPGDVEPGCWVQCQLGTGRTHQIRVHMASLGHPLLGDSLYGGTLTEQMQRQALHAHRLSFVHPFGGQALRFEAPLPDDMREALQAWGLSYNPAMFDAVA